MLKVVDGGAIGRALLLAVAVAGALWVGYFAERYSSRSDVADASSLPPLSEQPTSGQSEEEEQQLLAIGYAGGTEKAPQAAGVTQYVRGSTYGSYNLFTSGHAPAAFLMDMDGTVLHTWQYSFEQLWPNKNPGGVDVSFWRRVYAFENGDVLAVIEPFGIFRLDRNSNLIWTNDCGAHHDFYVRDDGHIFVLAQNETSQNASGLNRPVFDNFVVELGADGKELRRVSILDALRESDFHPLLNDVPENSDILHTNSIKYLGQGIEPLVPAFQPGRFVLSIRELDSVAVLDFNQGRIVWADKGLWHGQHEASILQSGHLLLFDNKDSPGRSKALEVNPATGEIVWAYGTLPGQQIYSATCGQAARLPNGNTLITEAMPGRAIEVTPEGATVWEYVNPNRTKTNKEVIAAFFDFHRMPAFFVPRWLPTTPDSGRFQTTNAQMSSDERNN